MQFPVPQFIDVEDKIIGPFTLKQFGFIFGGGILIVLLFKLLGTGFFFFLLAVPIGIVALILTFANFNGRKLYNFLPVITKFILSDKIFIFQHQRSGEDIIIHPIETAVGPVVPQQAEVAEPVQSKLKRLAMQLDQKNEEEFTASKNINIKHG